MSNKLVAYFSASGVTAKVAETLAEAIGADIFEIEPKVPYTEADLNWIVELKKIQLELQAFSPDKVVWDIDDLSKQPPWGKNISNDITNLSNYFVTSDGEDFITIFFNALEKAKKLQMDLTIESV